MGVCLFEKCTRIVLCYPLLFNQNIENDAVCCLHGFSTFEGTLAYFGALFANNILLHFKDCELRIQSPCAL